MTPTIAHVAVTHTDGSARLSVYRDKLPPEWIELSDGALVKLNADIAVVVRDVVQKKYVMGEGK
jgi:hypothetical protein